MRGSGFVDVAGVTQSRIGTLVIAGLLDTDRYTEERASILPTGGGRIVGEELRNAVGGSVRLESLLEKDIPNGRGSGESIRTRVNDLRKRETKNIILRGEWQGQNLAQGPLLGLSVLLLDQTATRRLACEKM